MKMFVPEGTTSLTLNGNAYDIGEDGSVEIRDDDVRTARMHGLQTTADIEARFPMTAIVGEEVALEPSDDQMKALLAARDERITELEEGREAAQARITELEEQVQTLTDAGTEMSAEITRLQGELAKVDANASGAVEQAEEPDFDKMTVEGILNWLKAVDVVPAPGTKKDVLVQIAKDTRAAQLAKAAEQQA